MRVGVISLGCPKNLVDTEVMLGELVKAGHQLTQKAQEADILIVNTCAFIESARREAEEEISKLKHYKKKYLIVAGCYSNLIKQDLFIKFPFIDGIIGCGSVDRIAELIDKLKLNSKISLLQGTSYIGDQESVIKATPFYSAYVKIADGCDQRCSYCLIPQIRGPYKSRKMGSIIREVRSLVKKGVVEINLIAQDSARYGLDIYKAPKLALLLEKLAKIEKLRWIRVLYANPWYITDELLKTISENDKLCKYLDMPIQHGSEKILKLMGRGNSIKKIKEIIGKIRELSPKVTLRSTFIVGFPGETGEDFKKLLDLLKELKLDRVGIFEYSREKGTKAAQMRGQVPKPISRKRYEKAMELQSQISKDINRKYIGDTLEVLIEGKVSDEPSLYKARSFRDAPDIDGAVIVHGNDFQPGEMINCRITDAAEHDLTGEEIHVAA
ncbi:MAG: 30S ribosomal protein S12 methylthiotransferase RimO [bacterium]